MRNPTKPTTPPTLSLLFVISSLAAAAAISSVQTQQHIHQESSAHFAPKLLHQPASVQLEPQKPHTIECPVESKPESEIKWFKNDQLLADQPAHLDQTGAELIFFSVSDQDSGDYHCVATNYLGSATSQHFKLTVKSSVYDARIKLEPQVAQVAPNERAQFTCSINSELLPTTTTNQNKQQVVVPEISWRRNDQPLKQVIWLESTSNELPPVRSSSLQPPASPQYFARQTAEQEFVLIISEGVELDDNATFSCLVHNIAQIAPSSSSINPQDLNENSSGIGKSSKGYDDEDNNNLPHESNQARLRVFANHKTHHQMDVHLAPAIDDLNSRRPNELRPTNQTTNLSSSSVDSVSSGKSRTTNNSLSQTLSDLYELVKPTLVLVGILSLIGLVFGLQILVIRRRNRENRYMKHQGYVSSSASNGSGGSGTNSALGAIGGLADCDPVLSSLLQRTLSAPNGASLSGTGFGGGKGKYRSYRDHMRKVAAVNGTTGNQSELMVGNDLFDGSDAAAYFNHQQQQLPLDLNAAALPNLYNQSLAAREQARSLLRSQQDHMRSLNNLNQLQKSNQLSYQHSMQQQQQDQRSRYQQNGSHLNLPLQFAYNSGNTNRNWPAPLLGLAGQQQQQQQQLVGCRNDEHYQLVNCSSVSPSSSSYGDSGNSAGGLASQKQTREQKFVMVSAASNRDSASLNHYSIIEPSEQEDDYEDRYEELDCCNSSLQQQQQSKILTDQTRTSTFVAPNSSGDEQQQRSSSSSSKLRASFMSNSGNSSSSGFGTSSSRCQTESTPPVAQRSSVFQQQDQLSPYAVSPICHQQPPPPPVAPMRNTPPPSSDAMRALNEQFDINQLMLLEDAESAMPFDTPPPPPLPPSSRQTGSKPVETKRRSK